jgi:ATP-binding protein involved in chromosome partitioning
MPTPIIITSGKGGVGKTTVSVNLALALAEKGLRVSLLDADLMDPTTHLNFKIEKEKIREYGKMLTPLRIKLDDVELEYMGLGPFIPRGVGVALSYEKTTDFIITLLKFVRWGGDYLIIDSPPGSIDVNVKLFKELKGRARAAVVGEPHVYALEDNMRMLDLLRMYEIDVRAIVLNKYDLFIPEIAKAIENEYLKLGLRIIRVPWDRELQASMKPELFNELAEVIVA